MSTKTKQKKNPPVEKFQDGLIAVSVWENATDKGTFYSVTHERSYKDEKGDWHKSDSYPDYDIQTLRKLLDLAHSFIIEAKAKARAEKKEEQDGE